MFRSAATQEGCKSIGRGHDFDNFNCNPPPPPACESILGLNCASSESQLWLGQKLIVTGAPIVTGGISDQIVTGCDCVGDGHGQVHHIGPSLGIRQKCSLWRISLLSDVWCHQIRNVAARNVHLPTIVFSQTPLQCCFNLCQKNIYNWLEIFDGVFVVAYFLGSIQTIATSKVSFEWCITHTWVYICNPK